MSQIRAMSEKKLLALLISVGPGVPHMLKEFASGLPIHFHSVRRIVEKKRWRETERDKLNPFSNNLWELESNCYWGLLLEWLWKGVENVVHTEAFVG